MLRIEKEALIRSQLCAGMTGINHDQATFLIQEIDRLRTELGSLRGDHLAVVAWLRRTSERMNDATLAHAADCIEDGEHRHIEVVSETR